MEKESFGKTVCYHNMGLCPVCDGLNEVKVKDRLDEHTILEAETECVKCGHKDYWAFGWFAYFDKQGDSIQ